MPGSAPFPVMPSGPLITRPAAQEGSQGGPSGSSPFYQSPATYGFQTPSPFMMQTPPHTLFFEGGSSSQVRQPDAEPEEQQSPLEEEQPLPELEEGGIQRVTVDGRHVEPNPMVIDIDYRIKIYHLM
ncbi:hypothetical protein Gotur_024358 [Gossypium turneri]